LKKKKRIMLFQYESKGEVQSFALLAQGGKDAKKGLADDLP